jgi:hypothetical protein
MTQNWTLTLKNLLKQIKTNQLLQLTPVIVAQRYKFLLNFKS